MQLHGSVRFGFRGGRDLRGAERTVIDFDTGDPAGDLEVWSGPGAVLADVKVPGPGVGFDVAFGFGDLHAILDPKTATDDND